ncbi:TonB-dependent siderophore receptor [Oleiharenicola sp. Vm1]|uniref:TonB-dependent siderophore receptor n=1 Tax=Oleiharenicola sp. Vm1 TaxID=3398393 RepID=UPI0039F587D5
MKTPIPRMITLAFALTSGAMPALRAQTAAAPETTPPAKEDVYTLTPFVVNTDKDVGYVAVDSLAGGRTNTPVKFTPTSMSSLTRTFIDDLGIQNVRDALKWTPNVVPQDLNAGKGFGGAAFQDWAFNYRGAGAGEQGGPGPTRNYFSFYQNQDAYNVERIEFLRGPNSIIFGLGTVGGQLSTYTKIPRLDRNFVNAAITIDDNGSNRYELDVNRKVNDTLALRLNAVNDNNHGWRQNDVNHTKAVDLAGVWKITDDAQLRIEGEYAKIRRTLISSTIGDKLSGWDGTTASNTWGAAPTGSARTVPIQNAGAWGDWLNPFWVYIPSLPDGKKLMGWAGGYASSNSLSDSGQALNWQPSKGWYPTQIKLPWESTYQDTSKIPVRPSNDWTYGNGVSDIDYRDLTVTYDQRINQNFDFTAAFYRYYDTQSAKDYEGTGGAAIDINKQLPDGTANPNYGKAFADFFLSKQTQSRNVTEGRAQLNYHFDSTLFGKSWKQLFSVSASQKELKQSARQYLGQVGNGTTITNPADWVQNMIWGRIYLDTPNQVMAIPEVVNGRAVAYMPKADGYWFDFDDTFKLTDFAAMSQSRLLDDALTLTLGARRDRYKEDLRELRRGPNLTDNIVHESQSGDTYSAGAVYFVTSNVGLVTNYSKNIQPPHAGSQPLLSGARPNPEEGKGLEYGLRFSTSDNKYYATLIRYDTQSKGHLVENPIGFRAVWQRFNEAQGNPTNSGNGNMAFSDTTSLDVKGYEFEITANPTKNLRLQASYGTQNTSKVDYYPDSRAYFSSNLAAWNAVVNNAALDAAKRTTLRSEIANVQNALDQAKPGSKQDGQLKYTAAFFANYTFTDRMLKGFEAGAGVTYAAKPYAAVYDNVTYYGDSRLTTNLTLQYHTKIASVPTHFALYIDNVLDDQDPWVTSYHWGYTDSSGRHIKDGYVLQAPRTFRLAARFEF